MGKQQTETQTDKLRKNEERDTHRGKRGLKKKKKKKKKKRYPLRPFPSHQVCLSYLCLSKPEGFVLTALKGQIQG